MKKYLFVLGLFLTTIGPAFSQKVLNSWVSPEYSKPAYRKVAVLAKISDKEIQQMVEDNAVLALREKGINAITSYLNFKESDLASNEAILARADQLQVDAVVVFWFGWVWPKPGLFFVQGWVLRPPPIQRVQI